MIVMMTGVMAVKGSGSKVQLHFISSRVSSKSCAGHSEDTEQLLIDLQQCHDISRPSQHKTWTDKVITPLRDRLVGDKESLGQQGACVSHSYN